MQEPCCGSFVRIMRPKTALGKSRTRARHSGAPAQQARNPRPQVGVEGCDRGLDVSQGANRILFAGPEFADEPFERRHLHRKLSILRLHAVDVGVQGLDFASGGIG